MSEIKAELWQATPGFDVRTVAGDKFVASVFGAGSVEKLARARMIAAAPEMLRAIEWLLEILEGNSGAGANFWEQDWRYIEAKKAQAKAEGKMS